MIKLYFFIFISTLCILLLKPLLRMEEELRKIIEEPLKGQELLQEQWRFIQELIRRCMELSDLMRYSKEVK